MTTQLHVVASRQLIIDVKLTLRPKPDVLEQELRLAAVTALTQYYDPLTGGAQRLGWPLGRNVYVSELYALLDKLPGVDSVEKTLDGNGQPIAELTHRDKDNKRLQFTDDGKQLVCLKLEPDEIIDTDVKIDIQVLRTTKNKP